MSKDSLLKVMVTFVVFLFAAAGIGYLFFPSAMLSVVGITSNAQMDFLVRTLAAALLALIPSAWQARKQESSSLYTSVILGMVIYMFLSSAVDLYAYLTQIVNGAAIPSILVRVAIGGVLLWLMKRR